MLPPISEWAQRVPRFDAHDFANRPTHVRAILHAEGMVILRDLVRCYQGGEKLQNALFMLAEINADIRNNMTEPGVYLQPEFQRALDVLRLCRMMLCVPSV